MITWRYLLAGILDTDSESGFGEKETPMGPRKGFVVHNGSAGGGPDWWGNSITLDSSDRILVTGGSGYYLPAYTGYTRKDKNYKMAIWRLLPDGTRDPTFGNDGLVVYNNPGGWASFDQGYSVAVEPSATGRILVVGSTNNTEGNHAMTLWRFLP